MVATLTIIVMLADVAGARLFQILENLDNFAGDPASMLFTRSGFSIFGGLILRTVAGAVFIHQHALAVLTTLDAAAPAMMLGYAIGRVGCQISGDGDWGNNIAGVLIPSPGVYPMPLYEALACLLLVAILWRVRRHSFKAGWLFSLYLMCAGAERLLIEQIRINNQLHLGWNMYATQAEVIASALILFGLIALMLASRGSHLPSPQARAPHDRSGARG